MTDVSARRIGHSVPVGGPGREGEGSAESGLANVRHSLRTPLNQVIGYSEMLQEEAADLGLEAYVPDLQKIRKAGAQLLTLVNENVTAARIDSGKLDLEEMQRDARTLLDLIIGYAELCREDASSSGRDSVVADLNRIRHAAEALLRFFQDEEFLAPIRDRMAGAGAGREAKGKQGPAATPGTSFLRWSPPPAVQEGPILSGIMLVVDDNEMNRDMLARRLERQGHRVLQAENGRKALEILAGVRVDVILLDILMPELDGVQTLERIKNDARTRHTPVIMLSALDELDSVVRCIEMGADDYLPKPFNPVLLKARIGACLEKKQLRDQEQAYLEQLTAEREKSERLLLNILPKSIADRLKQGETTIADNFREVTVLFADLVEFTRLASQIPAAGLVRKLNDIFSKFDWLADLHHLEKIKTIGDAYMAVGGLPAPMLNHAEAVAEMALDMIKVVRRMSDAEEIPFNIRIGLSSGPVTAGIIGSRKFTYDLWGDTVNLASRMESHGQAGCIQVSEPTYHLLRDRFEFEERGPIEIKGKGRMPTYFLLRRR